MRTRILYEMFLCEWDPVVLPGGGNGGIPTSRPSDADEQEGKGVSLIPISMFDGNQFAVRTFVNRCRREGIEVHADDDYVYITKRHGQEPIRAYEIMDDIIGGDRP